MPDGAGRRWTVTPRQLFTLGENPGGEPSRATRIAGMQRTRRPLGRVLAAILLTIVTGGWYLVGRHRRREPAGSGRRRDDGGGLAGVREPRRPLPRDLTGAAAAVPAEDVPA
jgi:hypothetical protein